MAKAATFETPLFVVVCKDLHDAVKDAIMCIDCNEVRQLGAIIDRHLNMQDAVVGVGEEGIAANATLS